MLWENESIDYFNVDYVEHWPGIVWVTKVNNLVCKCLMTGCNIKVGETFFVKIQYYHVKM
jgi:hypothetical protein